MVHQLSVTVPQWELTALKECRRENDEEYNVKH